MEAEQISVLVQKAVGGNNHSIHQLIELYHEKIFRMVFYRVRSKMDSEDITQEVFIQMVKYMPGLKEPAKFKGWLYRIAVNRITDFYRKKRVLSIFSAPGSDDFFESASDKSQKSADSQIEQKEFWQRFEGFIKILSKWEKEVFMLRFMDHLEIKEVCNVLQKNESTVKTHLYRAIKKLKDQSEFYKMLQGELS